MKGDKQTVRETDIAVIGMHGKFPKAENTEQLWELLINGTDCITRKEAPTSEYIHAFGVLEDMEYFDADYFGYSRQEALMADPQERHLLEGVHTALESAGVDLESNEHKVGLYCSSDEHFYVWQNLFKNAQNVEQAYSHAKMYTDSCLTTKVSYKLNLQGPSVLVKYSCATSLATIHLATLGLLNGDCDIAVAGGVSIHPFQEGYFPYDSTLSGTGYTKAFDQAADGFVPGNGLGLVVLKRAVDALADGDVILGLIKGSAINNDGNRKVGYAAPSLQGQQEVIAEALELAELSPDDLTYIEAHGTGTVLGDAIEIKALKGIFDTATREEDLFIGSVKTNVGHLNIAAGVTGFIKNILILNNKQIPASLNCENVNEELLATTKLTVCREPVRLTSKQPIRVGVSAFGVGGQNAHIILEQYQQDFQAELVEIKETPQLFVLSAKTEGALSQKIRQLKLFIGANPQVDFDQMAYTLQIGRTDYAYRYYVVAQNVADLIVQLKQFEEKDIVIQKENQAPIFLVSGAGGQGFKAGMHCYKHQPYFREQINSCFKLIEQHVNINLTTDVFVDETALEDALKSPKTGMPLLFSINYALATLWIDLKIEPKAIIGHSMGEYVAACIAGVFSLDDALKLVCARARLFEELPEGQMVSIPLSIKEITPYLTAGVDIAAINASKRIMISGDTKSMELFVQQLEENKISYVRVPANRPAHCQAVEQIMESFSEVLETVQFNKASKPIISTLTGEYTEVGTFSDPAYWLQQLRQPVQFQGAIETVNIEENICFIEIGSTDQLSLLAKRALKNTQHKKQVYPSFGSQKTENDYLAFLDVLGRLWTLGIKPDWNKIHAYLPGKTILPAHSFERSYFWNEKFERKGSQEKNQQQEDVQTDALMKSIKDARNTLDREIFSIISETMELDEEISIYDDLYELGFDSLTGVMISTKIKNTYNVEIPVQSLYEHENICQLSDYIQEHIAKQIGEDVVKEVKVPKQTEVKDISDLFSELKKD